MLYCSSHIVGYSEDDIVFTLSPLARDIRLKNNRSDMCNQTCNSYCLFQGSNTICRNLLKPVYKNFCRYSNDIAVRNVECL